MKNSQFILSTHVLAEVKAREDAVVELVEGGADVDRVRVQYRILWEYLFRYVFPDKWGHPSSPTYNALCSAFRHAWVNLVNAPVDDFLLYDEGPLVRYTERIVAYLRNTSAILEAAVLFAEAHQVEDALRHETTVSTRELVERAVRIANAANTHRIVIAGKGALESLSRRNKNISRKFDNFYSMLVLLTNAIKYSPEGSTIEMRFTHTATLKYYAKITGSSGDSRRQIRKKYSAEPRRIDYFFLTVSDEGIGIPAGEIKRITDGFDARNGLDGYRDSNAAASWTGFGLWNINRQRCGDEKPVRIYSPPRRRLEDYDPEFPGIEVRVSLAGW